MQLDHANGTNDVINPFKQFDISRAQQYHLITLENGSGGKQRENESNPEGERSRLRPPGDWRTLSPSSVFSFFCCQAQVRASQGSSRTKFVSSLAWSFKNHFNMNILSLITIGVILLVTDAQGNFLLITLKRFSVLKLALSWWKWVAICMPYGARKLLTVMLWSHYRCRETLFQVPFQRRAGRLPQSGREHLKSVEHWKESFPFVFRQRSND